MQTEFSDYFFASVLMVKVYLCCFTQFTVDQSKLTVNGSVLSDPPNVRYLAALYVYGFNIVQYTIKHPLHPHTGDIICAFH